MGRGPRATVGGVTEDCLLLQCMLARDGGIDDVDDARYESSAPDTVRHESLPDDPWEAMRSLTWRASRLRARANLVEFRAERMTDESAVVEGLAWVARLRRQAGEHEQHCHELLAQRAAPPDRRSGPAS